METIINKMIKGVQLTSDEVQKAVWNLPEVKTIKGESSRWSQSHEVIVKIEDKLYSLEYEKGLTESQEDEYYPQIAEEVAEIEETIKVKKFVGVEKVKQLSERDFLIEKSIQEFKQIEAENKRLIEIAEGMKAEYDSKIQYYAEKIQLAEECLLAHIQSQVDIKEMKENKTEFSIKFPSAKVSISKDKTVLVKPNINKCPDEYIKVKTEVDWINYKKSLVIDNGKAIDKTTGEVKDVEIQLIKGGEVKIKLND